MQYTEIYKVVKKLKCSSISEENFCDFSYFLLITEAVLTSTHNLCFGAKIRKIGIPLHTPVLIKVARTCFPDVRIQFYILIAVLLERL